MGVFLPCIQNIFGVLFFIRLSWIIGTAGVYNALLVVLSCVSVVSFAFSRSRNHASPPNDGSADIPHFDLTVRHCDERRRLRRRSVLHDLAQSRTGTRWVSSGKRVKFEGTVLGGAVGILFYLGTTIAGSMYIIGGVEIIIVSEGYGCP